MQEPTSQDALRLQLRRARKAANLSQEALARRLGISSVQVSRIETGARSTTLDIAQRWLEECGYAVESVSIGEPEAARVLALAVATLDEAQLQSATRVIRAWAATPDHIVAAILQLIAPYEPH